MDFIIITIGNEILSGDVLNTNATYMAKRLTRMGHRVRRIVVIPDDVDEIVEEVTNASKSADFVLVTGGLGATHDDVTAEAIAKAFNRRLVIDERVYNKLKKFCTNEEAIRKISSVPEGCEVIWNDVGGAPAFIIENVAVMPGVPAEMENTFEKIVKRFEKIDYFEEYVQVEGFEERIVDKLNKVVKEFPDVQIGSYPKKGYVLIKFSGSDEKRVKAAKERFKQLLK